MKEMVIDTSIVAKWFFEEENTDIALSIRDLFSDGKIELYAPDLIIYELANVFRFGNIDENLAKEFLKDFFDMQLTLIQPHQDLISECLTFAVQNNITIYDSAFLVLAKELGIKTVTADKKLYEKTKKTNFIIHIDDFKDIL